MCVEYIKVHFDPSDIRGVLLDGTAFGKTEDKLMVPAGTYIVTLSGTGYTPAQWSGVVAATDPDDPFQIVFAPIAPPPPAPPAAAPAKRRKKPPTAGV